MVPKGFFETYLNKPEIVAAIKEEADRATVLPEDMPRPDTMVPQVYATLQKHPALYQRMDTTVFMRWGFKPEHLSYLTSGEEAVVFQVYGIPFIIKATTSLNSDLIHGSQFVAKPTARKLLLLKDKSFWQEGETPRLEMILERWLYPYNAYRENSKTAFNEDWVILEKQAKKLLEGCLLYEGLHFKDQKLSNVRYYGLGETGIIGTEKVNRTRSYPHFPVVTDVGSLEGVRVEKTKLSHDPNEAAYLYHRHRDIYQELHSQMCPLRGRDAATQLAKYADMRWQQDQLLYEKLKKDGLSDDAIVERNLELAEVRKKGQQMKEPLIYDAQAFLRSR